MVKGKLKRKEDSLGVFPDVHSWENPRRLGKPNFLRFGRFFGKIWLGSVDTYFQQRTLFSVVLCYYTLLSSVVHRISVQVGHSQPRARSQKSGFQGKQKRLI